MYSPQQQCLRYLVEFSLPEDEGTGQEKGAREAAQDKALQQDALAEEEEEAPADNG